MNVLDGHARLSELVPLYAVGALEGEELGALEEHLDACPLCRAELRDLSEALPGAFAEPVEPPPGVLANILAETARAPTGGQTQGAPSITQLRHRQRAMGLAAALVALVLGVGSLAFWLGRSSASRMLSASSGKAVSIRLTGGAGSYLRLDLVGSSAVVASTDLPRLATGRTYQVWGLLAGNGKGTPVSLGLAGPEPLGARLTLPDLGAYTAIAVTAEPSGGTTNPTSAPLVIGAVKDA